MGQMDGCLLIKMHCEAIDEEGRAKGREQDILCLKGETMCEWSESTDV